MVNCNKSANATLAFIWVPKLGSTQGPLKWLDCRMDSFKLKLRDALKILKLYCHY